MIVSTQIGFGMGLGVTIASAAVIAMMTGNAMTTEGAGTMTAGVSYNVLIVQ